MDTLKPIAVPKEGYLLFDTNLSNRIGEAPHRNDANEQDVTVVALHRAKVEVFGTHSRVLGS